jgi:RNA polymerase sigma factor (sigma-70 family)
VRKVSIPAQVLLGPLSSRRLLAIASDTTLVEQIRRGNEAAFSVAFERHAGGLLGFCRHMVGSPQDAEDAVQHTFLAAFRELARGGTRELALKPWLYAVARNRCLSIVRSRREPTALEFDVPTEGLAEQVERRAELRELLRGLRDLPEDQRTALLLSEAGDLSHSEVAGVLGCEVAKVKALVFRARTALIHQREARDTACADIREQLATLRGNSLRRSTLRHHLRSCDGCRAYGEQVRRQRRMLAGALPVLLPPGLRSSVHAAAGLGGGSLGGGLAAGIGTGLSASVCAGTLAKVAAVGLIVGGAATVGEVLVADAERLAAPPPKVSAHAPAFSGPKPSLGREIAGRPVQAGVRHDEPGAAEGGARALTPEQRPGSVQPSAPRPAGEPGPRQERDESAAPSSDGERDGAGGHGYEADPVGSAPEVRRPSLAPSSGSPAHGGEAHGEAGPPPGTPEKGGPPSGTPDQRHQPSSTPDQRHQPSGPPDQRHQPSGPPDQRHQPSGPPFQGHQPSAPPAQRPQPSGTPEGAAPPPGPPATHGAEPPPGPSPPEPEPAPRPRGPAAPPSPAPGPHRPTGPSPPKPGHPGI